MRRHACTVHRRRAFWLCVAGPAAAQHGRLVEEGAPVRAQPALRRAPLPDQASRSTSTRKSFAGAATVTLIVLRGRSRDRASSTPRSSP
ncbi:MAG: hypothetical protein MZV63_13655 [Marinilabiliales bacterium]|nr:hypothetical protein [Marinilabiliales bacterium]